jgi:hypothetical protein
MRFFEKILVLGVIAAGVGFFWRARQPEPVASQPVPAEVPASAEIAPASIPAAFPSLTVPQPVSPLARTLSLLHVRLRLYKDSEINDPDDEDGRENSLRAMLAMLTDENVAEVIQSLSADELNSPFGSGALRHWMQVDPVTASNWLAARPETTPDQTLTVAENWAANKDGLNQYLDQLPDTPWKQSLMQDASTSILFQDPNEAVKLAQEMKPGPGQTNLMVAVANGWVSKDPNAALDWINSVSDPAMREQLIASAAQSYAVTDPAQAADWLVQQVNSGPIVKDAVLNILQTWVSTDPAGAANWAAQFPDGSVKASAIEIVANHWQQTDPAAATAWMQNLSGSPTPAN